MKQLLILICLLGITSGLPLSAQIDGPFAKEMKAFEVQDAQGSLPKGVDLFVGSSSIRYWSNVIKLPSSNPILNRGFGGSQMSDLLYYFEELVVQYKPKRVFVYEGDNDVSAGKEVKTILRDFKIFLDRMDKNLPDVPVYIISPKPSVARWELKKEYEKTNRALKNLAEDTPGVEFIDVWTPMLPENGEVDPNLFIEDQLHMNAKGYAIWAEVIKPYLK